MCSCAGCSPGAERSSTRRGTNASFWLTKRSRSWRRCSTELSKKWLNWSYSWCMWLSQREQSLLSGASENSTSLTSSCLIIKLSNNLTFDPWAVATLSSTSPLRSTIASLPYKTNSPELSKPCQSSAAAVYTTKRKSSWASSVRRTSEHASKTSRLSSQTRSQSPL